MGKTIMLADAFAATFCVPVGLIARAVVPALLLPRLPRPHAVAATDAGPRVPAPAHSIRKSASAPSHSRTQTTRGAA